MNPASSPPPAPPGLLIIAHGTRRASGVQEITETTQSVRQELPDVPLSIGFLEKCRPDIQTAVDQLASQNVRQILAVPLFLFAATHMKHDIPTALEQAVHRHPGLRICLQPPLSQLPAIMELSLQRHRTALARMGAAGSESVLILVGRGSHDPQATADFKHFCNARKHSPVDGSVAGCVLPALLVGDALPLPDATEQARVTDHPWVVIQPHLLFQGRLTQRLAHLAEQQNQTGGQQKWLLADHLGRDAALTELIAAKYTLARAHPRCKCTEIENPEPFGQQIFPLAR